MVLQSWVFPQRNSPYTSEMEEVEKPLDVLALVTSCDRIVAYPPRMASHCLLPVEILTMI
jgi:hypothetical protein